MRIGAIILCRYSSTRLEGKILMPVKGKPVILYIYERLLQNYEPKDITLATSTEESDDQIQKFCEDHQINCFRGSLENVSQRFYDCARSQQYDYAIRINGDNIFTDIPTMKKVLDISLTGKYRLISNVPGRTFPKGMSIECVNINYYGSILDKIVSNPLYKEHVTLYLYENEDDNFHYIYNEVIKEAAEIDLALDEPSDLQLIQRIINNFTEDHIYYNLKEIFPLYKKEINE